ncbi:MAG: septal ring lytic transglycosylase RlpA family protein [Ignavibacteriales bacterium]|nr:MAG: septal ring lytic transglycosylase RlpA family protein [Ignavibacteriales bacterium]
MLVLAGCSSSPRFTSEDKDTNHQPRYRNEPEESGSDTRTNNNPKVIESTTEIASFYAHKFHGKKTANGETYDMYAMTAAHISYPFNTEIRVTNLSNNKQVILRINDRKPDTNGRAVDLSYRAAELLGMIDQGIAQVRVEVLKWGQ